MEIVESTHQTIKKQVRIHLALLGLSLVASSTALANTPAYETLEQFCLATKADTPENCACGQAKADELLTPEEEQLVIGLMTEDPDAISQVMQMDDLGQSLMEKVGEITEGCD